MEIENRIRKLLALGERAGTEAEAQAAMEMAHSFWLSTTLIWRRCALEGGEAGGHRYRQNYRLEALEHPAGGYDLRGDRETVLLQNLLEHEAQRRRENANDLHNGPPFQRGHREVYRCLCHPQHGRCSDQAGARCAQAMADEGVTLNLRRWRSSFRFGFALRVYQRVEEDIKAATAGQTKASDGRALVLARSMTAKKTPSLRT